jgi:flavin-dependent thymidylate synthase
MTKEVQRWGDAAMYRSEPMPQGERGPRVYLLAMTADPLGAIASACKMYKGEVVRSYSDVTDDERREYLAQVMKTKLQAPFEFVHFHFMIEGVSRALTHQMVRQRTAAYAQESLRFAVKEDMADECALPPSLQGTVAFNDWLGTDEWVSADKAADEKQRMRETWDKGLEAVGEAYDKLIEAGMSAEDARGLLPHAVTTRLHYTTSLRALLDHAGNRLCTQAQFEWRLLWARMVEAIRAYGQGKYYHHSEEHGARVNSPSRWQFELLADVFKPVCYLTGKCEFKANFDRPCSIRSRVDANEEASRPSSEWGTELDRVKGNPIVAGVGHESVVRDEGGQPVFIGAIKPGEWLLDPNAAREK